MSKLSTQPYRGARDFYPEDYALQRYIFDTWRKVCQSFGYEEYMTPTIEPIELYSAKTSEEIVQEQTYSFTDRGERNVTIRPEMTPSVARLVASRQQEWGYPLRLFSIPNCMRYERPQKGRLREFWQLNADIFGVDGIEADIEMIQLADSLMKAFGAKNGSYEIRINSRNLLRDKIESAQPKVSAEKVTQLIDKRDKINTEDFTAELNAAVHNPDDLLSFVNSNDPQDFGEDMNELVASLDALGVSSVVLSPSVARGFDYYTGIVFEVFDTNPENNRSMFGGGRYDNLVGQFGGDSVPTVGFGMGDATLVEFLKSHALVKPGHTAASTQLVLSAMGPGFNEATVQFADKLRELGINVATDILDRKRNKKIKTPEKLGVRHVAFIGQEELDSNSFSVEDLQTGDIVTGGLTEVAEFVKSHHQIEEL